MSAPSERSVPEAARQASPLRVLLVEDSIDDADLMLEELRAGGYEIVHERVESERTLRAALARERWQLVLCDYAMPGFHALAALAIVKEARLDVPFIVISGAIGEETAVAAMRAGAHDFLIKGRLARLVPAVERELREAAVRAERATMQEQLLLSDRLVQIGTLAAGVAHEINNPLAYAMGNIAFALEELGTSEAHASIAQALQQALHGTERIRAITADLRVFSRSDDSGPQPVDVRRVLESAISMAWNQIRHRARLERDFHAVPLIAANENRLGQVFLNLLINAAQAIPEGRADEQLIRVSLRVEGEHVEVCVSDSGQGLSPEVRERLFQPFFTTKPKGVGTGLGLSICQKIVRDSGGEISAQSSPGGGSTFRVRLPIAAIDPSVKPPRPSLPPVARRGRVLVVDDERAIVDLIARMLKSEHDVRGVHSAREALAVLQTDLQFDVILCDLMMPGESGVDLYQALERAAPQLVSRIVFLSGGAFTTAARQLLARVDNPRIAKPFDTKGLRTLVREQVARRDASAQADGSRAAS